MSDQVIERHHCNNPAHWPASITPLVPTAGHHYVKARSLRARATAELDVLYTYRDYLLSDAGPDPWNVQHAAAKQAEIDLWLQIQQMAQDHMNQWREAARDYYVEGLDDE